MSLHDFWRTMVRDKYFVAAFVASCTLGAGLAAVLMTPVYRAQVVLMPVDDQGGGTGLAGLAQQYGALASLAGVNISGSQSSKDEAIASLRSRAFTEQFIREAGLLPTLFAREWDASAGRWKTKDPDEIPTMEDAFERFDREVRSISENTKSGIITLTIDWRDPKQAARWGNELASRINSRMRDRAINEGRQHIKYLQNELNKTSVVEIRQAIYRLVEAKIKEIAVASVRVEYSFRIVDPAVAPDDDHQIRPRRAIMLGLGFVGGLTLSLLGVFVHAANSRERRNA